MARSLAMARSARQVAHSARRRQARVVIAHPHRTFAEALRLALSSVPGVRVAGVAHDRETLVEVAREREPEVVLLDETMAGGDGLAAGWEVKRAAPSVRVVVLSTSEDERRVAEAAEAGADAVVSQLHSLREVVRSVQALSRGQVLIDPDLTRRALLRRRQRREEDAALGERLDRLTPRETQILQLMADGLHPEEIARELGISPHTLRTHVQNVLMKLRVHSKLQAVTAAIRFGRIQVRRAVEDVEEERANGSRDAAYAARTTGSTSAARSGRGR